MIDTKHIILLGPPGSGKGTQGERIAESFGFYFFGTGDLMRQEAQKDSEIGRKFKAVWDQGEGGLVTDDLINEFVNLKLSQIDKTKGIIFDGYPRTVGQAENLSQVLQTKKEDLIVLNIEVTPGLLLERITTRRVCDKCHKVFFRPQEQGITKCDQCGGKLIQRQEDKEDVIKKRLEVYENQTKPLINYYKENGTIININGDPAIDEVTSEINLKLDQILK